jgi:uncharacterized membrane protein YdjX (TVP38/TMEM64 family)
MSNTARSIWYKQSLAMVMFCIVIGYLLTHADFISSFNQQWIDRDVRGNGLIGALYFFCIAAVITACGAPRQIVAFLGGYAFGSITGLLLATVATLVGCIITFYISKIVLKPIIRKKFQTQYQRINVFLAAQPTRKTIIIRLLPLGSNVLTNLVAGSTNVKSKAFFVGSFIGYIPQMLIFCLLGKGMLVNSEWQILASVVLLFVSSYLSFSLYRKHKRGLETDTRITARNVAESR